jgi:thioredoxin-like negative regulator of GroEL
MVAPIVETLSRDFAGTLKVVKVNVDSSPRVAQEHHASNIPMLLLLRHGALIDTVVGAQPDHVLRARVEHHLAACRRSTPPREPGGGHRGRYGRVTALGPRSEPTSTRSEPTSLRSEPTSRSS